MCRPPIIPALPSALCRRAVSVWRRQNASTPSQFPNFGARGQLRSFDLSDLLQTKFVYEHFAHPEFLDFPSHRHWELVHDLYVLRDLETGDLAFTECPNLLWRGRGVGLQFHERSNFFPKHFIGNSEDLDFADARTRIKEFFDFARVNVFAAPDDH